MTLRLNGSTSGYTEIDAPAVAGSNTLVLPTGNGTNGQVLSTNGSGALSWIDRVQLTRATSVATTSGTAIDFTSLPSWVRRITVMLDGVSTNGTASLQVQLGTSSGVVTTGYTSYVTYTGASTGATSGTTGFRIESGSPDNLHYGLMIITNPTSNQWVANHVIAIKGGGTSYYSGQGGHSITLAATLDRLRFTTTASDSFDAGTINIMYEG